MKCSMSTLLYREFASISLTSAQVLELVIDSDGSRWGERGHTPFSIFYFIVISYVVSYSKLTPPGTYLIVCN